MNGHRGSWGMMMAANKINPLRVELPNSGGVKRE